MENEDIRRLLADRQIEWIELAQAIKIPIRDFTRQMNSKRLSPAVRYLVLKAIDRISQRTDDDYF